MKAFKFGLIIMASAMIIFGLGGTAAAFHDGGVAHCDGCHTMHMTTSYNGTVGAHLQIGADPSSTCLSCHAGYGQFSADGSAFRAGGDFYWLTKDFTWSAHGHANTSSGESHGHNIIAADFPGLTTGDTTNTTAPGSSTNSAQYLSGQLGCNSCHDPHGSQGNESLLYGIEDTAEDYPGGYSFTNAAPIFLNAGRNVDVSDTEHSAYGSGMSEWCANCHADFVNNTPDTPGATMHPAGGITGGLGSIASNYNAYISTGVLGTANYWEIVPFETGATTTSTLDTASTTGAATSSNVLCLTCHRAHATAFPHIARWDMHATLISEDSHPQAGDGGVTGSDEYNSYYGRAFTAEQRSLCNKCHIQD